MERRLRAVISGLICATVCSGACLPQDVHEGSECWRDAEGPGVWVQTRQSVEFHDDNRLVVMLRQINGALAEIITTATLPHWFVLDGSAAYPLWRTGVSDVVDSENHTLQIRNSEVTHPDIPDLSGVPRQAIGDARRITIEFSDRAPVSLVIDSQFRDRMEAQCQWE